MPPPYPNKDPRFDAMVPPAMIQTASELPVQQQSPAEIEAKQNAEEEYKRFFDFGEAKIILKRIIDDWRHEIEKTERNRKKRDVSVNVEQLRQTGQIDEDETLVPVRVVDTNIQRELPSYINYLKNSRRLCTFRSLDNPNQDTQNLELDYTRGMTYLNWETPHYKCIDGGATHGWDLVEVVYDERYPLNAGIEHIGHDMLFFPCSVKDIQQAPRIVRAYDITLMQLKTWVSKFGFAQDQVNIIINSKKDGIKANETFRIYKKYCKYDGKVYVAWFECNCSTSDWLKKPQPLSLDLIDIELFVKTGQIAERPVKQYPIFLLPYRETEKPKIMDHYGRVYLDEHKQEAQTAILSGFINGLTRASNIYAAKAQEDGTGSSLKSIENIKLTGGKIFDKPIQFWSPGYPDPMVIKALEFFDTSNSQETNQVNFAALNREDSRKTAKEISVAEQQQSLLNSVQLTLFSTFIRGIYSYAWQIVQSQALQDKIKFMQVEQQIPVPDPMNAGVPLVDQMTGQPVMQTVYVNDKEILSQTYDIRAAGDVDVIQRQEKIQQMMQDWPVISQTALRDIFLAELMKLKYPDVGDKWASILMSNNQVLAMQQLISRLGIMLKGAVTDVPELLAKLSPQESASIQQTIQEAEQVTAGMQQQEGGAVQQQFGEGEELTNA